MEKEIIRVNVPGANGFYRLLVSAFYEADKTTFNRMIKAVSADPETLHENVSAILEFLPKDFTNYEERQKAVSALLEKKETKEQKRINKQIQAFCNGKDFRPVLRKPFEKEGILYCTDGFTAIKVKNRSLYTGEFLPEYNDIGGVPNLKTFFPDENIIKETYISYVLPDIKTIKAWSNNGKLKGNKGFSDNAALKLNDTLIFSAYIYKAMSITGSNIIYINPDNNKKPAYILSDNYTCLVLPFNTDNINISAWPETCLIKRTDSGEEILNCSDIQNIKTDPEIENSSVSVPETKQETIPGNKDQEPEKETVSVNPAEIKADSHGYSMESFRQVYSRFYNHLYNTGEYHRELVYRFDHELTVFEIEILKAYIEYRKDCISSDREAAAFCMAVDHIQYVEKENVPGIDPESVSAIENNSSVDPAGKEFTNDVTVHNEEEMITETIPDCSAVHVLPHRNAGSRNSSAYWNPSACSANARNMPVLHSSRNETITMQGNTSRSVNERIRPPT